MKPIIGRNLLLLVFTFQVLFSLAQERSASAIDKIRKAYTGQPHLSFSLHYLYAKEQAPTVVLDSLSGTYKISGESSWSMVDSVETIISKGLSITIYHRDKLLFLDQPDKAEAAMLLNQMDSLLSQKELVKVSESEEPEIRFTFLQHPLYRSAVLRYDPSTYLIQKLTYVLSPSLGEEVGGNSVVQIVFSNYNQEPIRESVFAVEKYCRRSGNTYVPSGMFEAYSLFLGSSKLQN